MLALTSPTSGGRSAGIVRMRTKATEFYYFLKLFYSMINFLTLSQLNLHEFTFEIYASVRMKQLENSSTEHNNLSIFHAQYCK
jgi:hypothetical protein